jgi:hypothetical protein
MDVSTETSTAQFVTLGIDQEVFAVPDPTPPIIRTTPTS